MMEESAPVLFLPGHAEEIRSCLNASARIIRFRIFWRPIFSRLPLHPLVPQEHPSECRGSACQICSGLPNLFVPLVSMGIGGDGRSIVLSMRARWGPSHFLVFISFSHDFQ
jgi:hypothetical protein